jgi:hypothetical protein
VFGGKYRRVDARKLCCAWQAAVGILVGGSSRNRQVCHDISMQLQSAITWPVWSRPLYRTRQRCSARRLARANGSASCSQVQQMELDRCTSARLPTILHVT